jgi:hypothetical protein
MRRPAPPIAIPLLCMCNPKIIQSRSNFLHFPILYIDNPRNFLHFGKCKVTRFQGYLEYGTVPNSCVCQQEVPVNMRFDSLSLVSFRLTNPLPLSSLFPPPNLRFPLAG